MLHSKVSSKLENASRIVVKIGTNVLMGNDGVRRRTPDASLIESIVTQIVQLNALNKEIILVSSGAIGFGAAELDISAPINDIPTRQACAAIGQPLLMNIYRNVFRKHRCQCAQLLLTGNDFVHKSSYEALHNCIEVLLKQKVIPIINENDSVSIEELGVSFGDNDNLSAMLATKIHADLLILLTDVDALYDKNPKKHLDAKRIPIVYDTEKHLNALSHTRQHETGSVLGTGGIQTKLQAVNTALQNNCVTIIGFANKTNILIDLISGADIGTIFVG